MEEGKLVGVMMIDQSAAFDLCDHHLLIEKLRLMGIDNEASFWMESYLQGRSQSILVDGATDLLTRVPGVCHCWEVQVASTKA